MVTLSNILAWRMPWTEKPGSYRPRGHKELDMTERLIFFLTYTNILLCFKYCVRCKDKSVNNLDMQLSHKRQLTNLSRTLD